jgi:hypothetical protein
MAFDVLGVLDALDVRRVETFGTRLNLELHFLTFDEGFEPIHGDRRKVDEHILAAILLNEAVPLRVIEPLHFPSGHAAASCGVNRAHAYTARGKPTPVCGHLYRRRVQICQENTMSCNEIPYQTQPCSRQNI